MRTTRRPWLLVIGVAPLALLLSGCFGLPGLPGLPGGSADDRTAEELIEGATGGEVDIEMGELPSDFPVDAVPLVDGEVVAGLTVPGSGGSAAWQVTIAAKDESAADGAGALLEGAGFTHDGFAYTSDEYLVIVASEAAGGVHHVAYVVTAK